jgi:hypothetical protein
MRLLKLTWRQGCKRLLANSSWGLFRTWSPTDSGCGWRCFDREVFRREC